MRVTRWLVGVLQRRDRMLVAGVQRKIRLWILWDVVMMLLSWACLVGILLLDGVASAMCGVILGVQIARVGLRSLTGSTAYRAGWLEGRAQMVAALAEAGRRGLTGDEWLTGELDRDLSMLGLPPMPPPEDT